MRKTFKSGFNFVKVESAPLNPCNELIFKVADCWFFFQNNQTTAKGISRNNQKNPGFKKVILSII